MEQNNHKRPIPNYLKNIKINSEFASADYNLLYKSKQSSQSANHNTNDEKIEQFKQRLDAFRKVSTLKDAKELLAKTMPIKLDRTTFYVGKAKCIIINNENQLRICFDSPDEFISFDFV